jgi:hypothetical protein
MAYSDGIKRNLLIPMFIDKWIDYRHELIEKYVQKLLKLDFAHFIAVTYDNITIIGYAPIL